MKYVKILFMPLSSGTRDRRELAVAREVGFECHAAAKEEPENSVFRPDNVTLHNFSTRPLGEHAPNFLNRLLSVVTWGIKVRKLRPDAVSGHDLPGLTSAWIAAWFTPRKRRPLIIYDCHEYTLGTVNRGPVNKFLVSTYERFLMKRCHISIVVSDSIADTVRNAYRLKKRPVVAHNTPSYWRLDSAGTAAARSELCAELGIENGTFLVMTHGKVSPVRYIEVLIRALAKLEDAAVVVLGKGEEHYVAKLRQLAEELGVADRVLIKPEVAYQELWRYVSAADAGVITATPIIENAVFAMPNKLYENIHALTPLVASDLPDVKALVEKYDIGLVYKAGDENELAKALSRLREDKELYRRFKNNLETAKRELCWENDKAELEKALREAAEIISDRR